MQATTSDEKLEEALHQRNIATMALGFAMGTIYSMASVARRLAAHEVEDVAHHAVQDPIIVNALKAIYEPPRKPQGFQHL